MAELKGKKQVKLNISNELLKMIGKSKKALLRMGVEVRSRGMKITPRDTGNLVGSWYGPVVLSGSGLGNRPYLIEIGLNANYAAYVHENVGANFKKPGTQAKFLEQPLKEVESELLRELATDVKRG